MVKSVDSRFIHPFIHSFFFFHHSKIPYCCYEDNEGQSSCDLLCHGSCTLEEGTGHQVNEKNQAHIPGAV